jgi:hypothetical protein
MGEPFVRLITGVCEEILDERTIDVRVSVVAQGGQCAAFVALLGLQQILKLAQVVPAPFVDASGYPHELGIPVKFAVIEIDVFAMAEPDRGPA